ncbi:MAG TPA: hypothetical protein VN857_04355 [Chthoniobacterales bacterium]|nr:hypothetical protein [Chthoniobacterales bacterium]
MAWLDIFFGGIALCSPERVFKLSVLVNLVKPELAPICDVIARGIAGAQKNPGNRLEFVL